MHECLIVSPSAMPANCARRSLRKRQSVEDTPTQRNSERSVGKLHLDSFSFTSFQARRQTQSSLCSSIGMIILALQYLQYLRFSFVPLTRILWSKSKTVDSCGGSGKGSRGSDSFGFLRM